MSNTKGIDVNANITPISHDEIEQVDSLNWSNNSLTELYDQLTTLQERLTIAQRLNYGEVAVQLQKGIDRIQDTINKNSATTGETFL